MKIAILTLPLHTNYGGILQAYALQTVLERMGHKAFVISPTPPRVKHNMWVMPLVYAKRVFEKYFLRRDISVLYDRYQRPRQYTDRFISRYIHVCRVDDFDNFPNDFDAIVVGSDQIWRPKYSEGYPGVLNSFLSFIQDDKIKCISYAASFGVSHWEYSDVQTEMCKSLVSRFTKLSVREISAVELCRKYLNRDAEFVLDPTMLLDISDYSRLAGRNQSSARYVMSYILDSNEEKEKIVDSISHYLGFPVVTTNSKVEYPTALPTEKIQKPVEDWLKSAFYSSYIITDSFHACVFAILFHKPFTVIRNGARGNARIESLLNVFELEDRYYNAQCLKLNDIDYSRVDETLNRLRLKSMSFLVQNI